MQIDTYDPYCLLTAPLTGDLFHEDSLPRRKRRDRHGWRRGYATISSNSQANWFFQPDYLDASWLIPYAASGNPAVAVNVGDLCYDAGSGVAYPAGQQPSQGSEAADQILFARNFIGCPTDGCLATETNPNRRLNVRTRGYKAFICPSQTFTVGQMVGIYSNGTNSPDPTQVDAALTQLGAIGMVVPAPGNPTYYNAAVTTVYVYFEAAHAGDYDASRSNLGFLAAFQLGAVSTTDTVTNTATETAFATTAVIPANYLAAGDALHIRLAVEVTAQNSTNTNTIKLKIQTASGPTFTVLVSTGAQNVAANGVCLIDVDVFFTAIGATGSFYMVGDQAFGAQGTATRSPVALGATAINTTETITIQATCTQSAASAGNITQLLSLEVTKKRK